MGVLSPQPHFLHSTILVEQCLQSAQSGHCNEHEYMWFYNSEVLRCEQFVYSGCGGNDNIFATEDMCSETCGRGRVSDQQVEKHQGKCG